MNFALSQVLIARARPHIMPAPANSLAIVPTANVTIVPASTYHVHASGVNRFTAIIVTSPAANPTSAPLSLARLFHVPSKNTPSNAP